MIIKDEKLLKTFREKVVCEWCKRKFYTGLDPHHIFSRGAGRVDIPENLVSLCRECHNDVHLGHIMRIDLLAIAAVREGINQDKIEERVHLIRRTPKGKSA